MQQFPDRFIQTAEDASGAQRIPAVPAQSFEPSRSREVKRCDQILGLLAKGADLEVDRVGAIESWDW